MIGIDKTGDRIHAKLLIGIAKITQDAARFTTYAYDGAGRRVVKEQTTVENQTTVVRRTEYVYDVLGQLAAEYSTHPDTTPGLRYVVHDAIGSTRALINSTGVVVRCYDYLPFGEPLTNGRSDSCFTASTDVPVRFTGQERDRETATQADGRDGLDYFGARYFSGAQGRFISPDQPFVDQAVANPQSWNLYSYVRNNPLKHVDPDGRGCVVVDPDSGDERTDNEIPGPSCEAIKEEDSSGPIRNGPSWLNPDVEGNTAYGDSIPVGEFLPALVSGFRKTWRDDHLAVTGSVGVFVGMGASITFQMSAKSVCVTPAGGVGIGGQAPFAGVTQLSSAGKLDRFHSQTSGPGWSLAGGVPFAGVGFGGGFPDGTWNMNNVTVGAGTLGASATLGYTVCLSRRKE